MRFVDVDPAEIAAAIAQVDDPAHKLAITSTEAEAVFAAARDLGYPVKVANGLPVLLIDDADDLWMVDAVKAVRRAD